MAGVAGTLRVAHSLGLARDGGTLETLTGVWAFESAWEPLSSSANWACGPWSEPREALGPEFLFYRPIVPPAPRAKYFV